MCALPYPLSMAQPSVLCDTSLTADFPARDTLPQATISPALWYIKNWNNGWGPRAYTYPPVAPPAGCHPVQWKRNRIIAVAKKYIGLPYQHHHIPDWDPPPQLTRRLNESKGLDCSNYTAWVYNYGLGIKFTSAIRAQANGPYAPGRILAHDEAFQPGDLLFILKRDRSKVSHVVIFLNKEEIIDSHGTGVKIRRFNGWYKTHFSHARRIIE